MPENDQTQQPVTDAPAAWSPTHQHYKGGMYRVLGAGARPDEMKMGEVMETSRGNILVTEDIAHSQLFTIYESADGDIFAQPTERFEGYVDIGGPGPDEVLRRRFTPLSPAPESGADVPTQDNAQPASEKPKATGYTMNAAEILDRFHLAQATLNGAPVLALLGEVIQLLMKGAADESGVALGRRLAIVTNEAVAAAKKKAGKPTLIMPGNAPGVPNGLGGKRH
jgi:hypothetical protein